MATGGNPFLPPTSQQIGGAYDRGGEMAASFWIYIITDKPYGTLYTGVTNDIARRIWEHKTGAYPGFSRRYKLHTLVYYEE